MGKKIKAWWTFNVRVRGKYNDPFQRLQTRCGFRTQVEFMPEVLEYLFASEDELASFIKARRKKNG